MPRNIVLVPGFSDSDLKGKIGNVFNKLWFPDSVKVAARFGSLKLSPDGLTPSRVGPLDTLYQSIAPDIGIKSYSPMYGLYRTIADNGDNVAFFAYDWRLSLAVTGQQLATFLRNSYGIPGGPFTVIAHSMGGLVARMAHKLADNPTKAEWLKTIYLCTPHGGSFETVKAFVDLLPLAAQRIIPALYVFFQKNSGTIKFTPTQNFVDTFWQIMVTLPGLISLLPNVFTSPYPFPDENARLQMSQDDNWKRYNRYWDTTMIDKALPIWTALNEFNDVKADDICIVGTQTPTSTAFGSPADDPNLNSFLIGDGDGVVPRTRQQLPGSRVIAMPGMDHAMAPQDSRVHLLYATWVDGSDTVPATVQPPSIPADNLYVQGLATPPSGAPILTNSTIAFPALPLRFDP